MIKREQIERSVPLEERGPYPTIWEDFIEFTLTLEVPLTDHQIGMGWAFFMAGFTYGDERAEKMYSQIPIRRNRER